MDKNKIYFILVIKNIVSIICFTILSIVFNHWWIVLFSILFLTIFKSSKRLEEDDEEDV